MGQQRSCDRKRTIGSFQTVIKLTSHYREGIIHFSSESQMIFTVSNFDQNDLDFKKIRSAVEKVVETGNYRMMYPSH